MYFYALMVEELTIMQSLNHLSLSLSLSLSLLPCIFLAVYLCLIHYVYSSLFLTLLLFFLSFRHCTVHSTFSEYFLANSSFSTYLSHLSLHLSLYFFCLLFLFLDCPLKLVLLTPTFHPLSAHLPLFNSYQFFNFQFSISKNTLFAPEQKFSNFNGVMV